MGKMQKPVTTRSLIWNGQSVRETALFSAYAESIGKISCLLFSMKFPVRNFKTNLFQSFPPFGGRIYLVFHPETHGKGWPGTSTKPLVIGHHPSLESENLLESEAFLSLAGVQ
jgi:hypothetical protein